MTQLKVQFILLNMSNLCHCDEIILHLHFHCSSLICFSVYKLNYLFKKKKWKHFFLTIRCCWLLPKNNQYLNLSEQLFFPLLYTWKYNKAVTIGAKQTPRRVVIITPPHVPAPYCLLNEQNRQQISRPDNRETKTAISLQQLCIRA